jgi:ubiquinone/menaquinone biosynthesis C-methylase UbiE
MIDIFKNLFMKAPDSEHDGIYRFGNERDGDHFDELDFQFWHEIGFKNKWNTTAFFENKCTEQMLKQIINGHENIIDLACGPGMGFIPSIKKMAPSFPCLATDASFSVLNEWKKYLDSHEKYADLGFAQFSLFNIPINDGSVSAYSSFIGISSTRNGESGYNAALSEIHRTLKSGGLLYTVETEWTDIPTILSVFEKMNLQPWDCFCGEQHSWHDRFSHNGFDVLYNEPFEYRALTKDDNELGEAAEKLGVKIGISSRAYIIRKR